MISTEEETEGLVKVFFEFYNEILEEDYVESLWASIENEEEGEYRLKNIPFFVTSYASEDVVLAEVENGRLVVKGLIKESGNSTLQIMCLKKEMAQSIQKKLEGFGCAWEGSHLPGYFSVDVPANIDYQPIKKYLDELEMAEVIGYAEACLAHK
ncbi:DUF4265 domain-containing protein [Nibribacter koreensis]|uniref:DUF4265 domain-containing protein n=1 Tax=Nibribacter koreensis TaxID=1084519 RepID=A0ABP8G0I8_9BACT